MRRTIGAESGLGIRCVFCFGLGSAQIILVHCARSGERLPGGDARLATALRAPANGLPLLFRGVALDVLDQPAGVGVVQVVMHAVDRDAEVQAHSEMTICW